MPYEDSMIFIKKIKPARSGKPKGQLRTILLGYCISNTDHISHIITLE